MTAVDLIRHKRDGHAFDGGQLREIVRAVTAGDWPDYQTAALLMAVYLRGLSREETAALEGQKAAFETVIAVYDPGFSTTAAPQRAKTDRSTLAKRVTGLLKGKDLRGSIPVTLRDGESPLRASDIAQCFITREGMEVAADGCPLRSPDASRECLKDLHGTV